MVFDLYPLDFPKKRLAARKTFQLGESDPSSDSAQAIRRPPPLPPEASLMNKKPLIVKGPPLPAVPRPRPVSSVDQTHSLVVKAQLGKSVSVGGIIPRSSTAEGMYCNAVFFITSFLTHVYNNNYFIIEKKTSIEDNYKEHYFHGKT